MKHYVGIDLGGTNIVAGVVDAEYRIVAKHSVKTRAHQSFEEVVADIAGAARSAVSQSGLSMADMASVGLGTPSCINPTTGLLVNANNLGWRNVPLMEEMKKHFDRPVFIRNDADCAALGEALAGAARAYDHALMVTLGTGVGGGIIMNKRIFNGCDQMGAEIGHTKLVYGGVQCTCGQYGCFESYASATALIRQASQAMAQHPESLLAKEYAATPDALDAKAVFDAARRGDETAGKVVDQYIDYLAAGLSTLICIFRPQVLIIGGGVSHAGQQLLGPLNEKIHGATFAAAECGVPPAIAASLGNDAGLIGAAMLGEQA
ncbi:MAG TPA: ROK family protein [Clostridia bacterium]|nr:ROK family protein [Clostridia bacterium]